MQRAFARIRKRAGKDACAPGIKLWLQAKTRSSYLKKIVTNKETTAQENNLFKRWVKRFGVAGFLFFLIKGLLWLIVPFLIGYSLW